MDIQSAALSGAHIITIPPQFLPKMVDHKYTGETVRQFNRDAAKAPAEIGKAKDAVASRRLERFFFRRWRLPADRSKPGRESRRNWRTHESTGNGRRRFYRLPRG